MKPSGLIMINLFLPVCLLLVNSAIAALAVENPVIAIVSSNQAIPYKQTIESFTSAIKQVHPQATINLTDSIQQQQPLITPSVVFALGSRAAAESLAKMPDTNLLATMILNDKVLEGSSNATSILLHSTALKQLEWLHRIMPEAKRVGVLYDPELNQQWVDEAKIAAGTLDLEIIAVAVNSPRDLPAALKSLGRQADSILGIADKTVYSGKTAKSVLLFSFRNKLPFVGLSGAWVKAGALYALDWDYTELGQQSAATILKILDGTRASEIKTQFPDGAVYLLNLKTAKHMKLNIRQELIDGASKVYQ